MFPRSASQGVVSFYAEGAVEVVGEEIEKLLEAEETEENASEVLARLVRIACGDDDPRQDECDREPNTGELLFGFPCNKVAVLYAVDVVPGSRAKAVTALRFCHTRSAQVSVDDLRVAKERLHLLRTGA